MSAQDSVRRAQERASRPEGEQPERQSRDRTLAMLERPIASTDNLRSLLNGSMASIERSLPDKRKVQRFYQMVLVTAQRTPRLLECTGVSVLGAALVCAQTGLELGPLGHAFLIPRRSKRGVMEAHFQLGYLGEAELAMRSGEYEAVIAAEVRERDYFDYEQGIAWTIQHRPFRGDRGEVTDVYGIAFLRGGSHHPFVVLTREDIEARRARSQTPQDGPWVTDWVAMARKTAIRALRSQLRLTAEAAVIQAADGTVFRSLEADLISQAPPAAQEDDSDGPPAAGDRPGEQGGAAAAKGPPPPDGPPEQQTLA